MYRDVADLIGQRVPIRGEAGIGYVLDRHFDMPPLMLTLAELEAAVLGAHWVADRGDAVIARAARDPIPKKALRLCPNACARSLPSRALVCRQARRWPMMGSRSP